MEQNTQCVHFQPKCLLPPPGKCVCKNDKNGSNFTSAQRIVEGGSDQKTQTFSTWTFHIQNVENGVHVHFLCTLGALYCMQADFLFKKKIETKAVSFQEFI